VAHSLQALSQGVGASVITSPAVHPLLHSDDPTDDERDDPDSSQTAGSPVTDALPDLG